MQSRIAFSRMRISVIIPALNEEKCIGKLLSHLGNTGDIASTEIIVVDGGCTDNTKAKVESFNHVQWVESPKKGRAVQMNYGVEKCSGDILYFVHADTLPPETWKGDILSASKKGAKIGGFRFKFDSDRWLLKFNSWCTRFNILSFRGGDQSLFCTREFFNELNGYADLEIMEEYDLIKRAKSAGQDFKLIPKSTLVSARKYENNSYLKVNWVNFLAMLRWRLGTDSQVIKSKYKKALN